MKLLMNYPASWWKSMWREALPSGNGVVGAAVYGAVHEETVMLTHADLWRGGQSPEMPNVSDWVSEVRSLLLAGEADKADRVLANALLEKGYQPRMAWPLPLGDLKLTMATRQAFKNYRRTLDMATGEVAVSWIDGGTTFERKLFVSRTRDMVVCEIRAEGTDLLEAELTFDLHHRGDVRRPNVVFPEGVEVRTEGRFLFYAAKNDDGTDFGAVLCVTLQDGTIESLGGAKIGISQASQAMIRIIPFVKEERTAAWARIKQELEGIPSQYAVLLDEHVKVHKELFQSMRLDLHADTENTSNEELLLQAYQGEAPLELIEKMWAYGRYLLISSSRPASNPCHLYGLWCGEYEGLWAFHMVNENLQMIYWQALSGNMPELLLSVFHYVESQMDDYRENARRLYGCRGIYIPAPTAPGSGLLKHVYPHIIHWTGGAGWVAQHYYNYFLHTQDEHFLRQKALPFLREVALFYEDFFTLGEDGYYVSSPSNSPENTPGNYWEGQGTGAEMQTTMNATLDFAIAKEVINNLIKGASLTGTYAEEILEWQIMLDRIPPYQINEDGAVREWMHPFYEDNYHHRHQSHLYPVFPGTEVTPESDPALFEAFVMAVRKRLVVGLNEQTGWSLAHMANIYARLRMGDSALECLDILSRSSIMNNLFTTCNDWRGMGIGIGMEHAPFQIDANMGWTAAIQEMLMFSQPGRIDLLPALPQKWRKGAVGPMLAQGAVEVTCEWDQDSHTVNVSLRSRHQDQSVELVLPHPIRFINNHERKESKRIDLQLDAGRKVDLKVQM
ncbi:alpha-L-fucosidase [Paenibacillus pectinilyticus]|uniref:Alpha-L-fucosidase n=1 Tax=Paenibacillus pectinilyticus TaxID=512399 RepID=A0A1C1A3N8_9BACL|nr:glycoside hydrolase N-terminal domain-containing protein [Paenibacillus pectinilyticus]OCT15172.1 alpha-L-fucosidase [Paenibacillus pectinilyticus]